jgi:hypothetical protein
MSPDLGTGKNRLKYKQKGCNSSSIQEMFVMLPKEESDRSSSDNQPPSPLGGGFKINQLYRVT